MKISYNSIHKNISTIYLGVTESEYYLTNKKTINARRSSKSSYSYHELSLMLITCTNIAQSHPTNKEGVRLYLQIITVKFSNMMTNEYNNKINTQTHTSI